MVTEARINTYMVRIINMYPGDFIDSKTGELYMTTLAEAAAEHFGEDGDEIPEIYFEVAFHIAEATERLP